MYTEFFNFTERPFSLTPDPSFLYMGKGHRMALTMLNYGLRSEAGITVISGEVGAGKTTLIHHVLAGLGEDITVGLISNTHNAFGELLEWVLMAFGLDYKNKTKTELYQLFSEYLIEQYAQNKRTVLIIDEAQNFGVETLEELRMLSNINADKDQLLQLVLVGQPQLQELLHCPELEQFVQRVSSDFHIGPLAVDEITDYINHRLAVAGREAQLFDDKAAQRIAQVAGGTPRKINILCDTALVYGFAQQAEMITVEIVEEVLRDKAKYSVFRPDKGARPTAPAPVEEVEIPYDTDTARALFTSLWDKKK